MMLISMASSYAGSNDSIKVSPKFCKHGLNQPGRGDFAVFVFCDDALGTQIGIILTKPGVGPIELTGKWSITNRFWQEGPWMTNVKEYVWAKSGNYLYVVTSEVYGEEAFYELNLRQRRAVKLLDGKAAKSYLTIEKVDNNIIIVNNYQFRMKD